ncbi:MAG: response regulator transcription factor [Armatimonadetes bacterium]|nr:response regulator transcription factor [Armatimonadota bacterium]
MDVIKVLLVDDHDLFRRGLAGMLARQPDFDVVGEVGDGLEAVERAAETMPDVILMDVYMPRCDGIEATRRIKARMPYVKVVMLTVSEEEQKLFEAIKAGAQGYLLKKIAPRDLYAMVRAAAHGEAPISPVVAGTLIREFSRMAQDAADPCDATLITPREQDVLGLVAQGASNKQIAAALHLSEHTVRNHLRNILEKLHLHNRAQAAAFAVRAGLARPTSIE